MSPPLMHSFQRGNFPAHCPLSLCVCVCQEKRAAGCRWGGVKRPGGFEHCRPARLTVCFHNGIFTSASPSLYLCSSPDSTKNLSAKRKDPPLLSASVCSFFLWPLWPYQPSPRLLSLLLNDEQPPTSGRTEQPHGHQSAGGLLRSDSLLPSWLTLPSTSFLSYTSHIQWRLSPVRLE